MRKISILTLFCLTVLTAAVAGEKDDFQFGIRLGAQFSNIKGDVDNGPQFTSQYAKSLVGPAFGFIFEIPVLEYFEIRPELNFGSQGQRFKVNDLVYSKWMGYVQVPILFRGQYGSDKVRGFAHVGPQFGFGTFILDRLRNNDGIQEKHSYSFSDQKLKPFDAGIAFGAGVEFPSVKGMEVEARYYAGLANINDYGVSGLKTRNNSLHLTVSFKF